MWICNYRSEWVIVDDYPFLYKNIYYTKKKNNNCFIPFGLFINNFNNSNIIEVKILDEEYCYQILEKYFPKKRKLISFNHKKIYLKSTIIKNFKNNKILTINDCSNSNINGVYISNYKNKYDYIYKHSLNDYWIYNCIK